MEGIMTPQEIFEYKQQWKSKGIPVTYHSDYQLRASNWLKKNIQHHQYIKQIYTDVYQHTALFQDQQDADKFKQWINDL